MARLASDLIAMLATYLRHLHTLFFVYKGLQDDLEEVHTQFLQ